MQRFREWLPDNDLPSNFQEVLAKLRARRRQEGDKRFSETLADLRGLENGEDPEGIGQQYYPGWQPQHFTELLAALNRHAYEDYRAYVASQRLS